MRNTSGTRAGPVYNPDVMERPVSRRAWLSALVSGTGALAAACSSGPTMVELDTPEGKVLQREGNDLLVLVSGYKPRYQLGETIRVNVVINNQSPKLMQAGVRVKVLSRGDQVVAQAEVAQVSIGPDDAASVDREVLLSRDLVPGPHTLEVEIPPWRVEGREAGPGAQLRTPVMLANAGGA